MGSPAAAAGPEIEDGARHSRQKRHGIHYTPTDLALFVARRALSKAERRQMVILDPACGDGELLLAVAAEAARAGFPAPHLVGLDRDPQAVAVATDRLEAAPIASCVVRCDDFLTPELLGGGDVPESFDLVISNPPYVRTQVLGASRAQALGRQFGLQGRVDLYHAFVAAITAKLEQGGLLGLLCSNRFMTTRSGGSLRTLLARHFQLAELWDLGDTKLFEAAVLPAVVIARRTHEPVDRSTAFIKVYEDATGVAPTHVDSLLKALDDETGGIVSAGGRTFNIERGELTTGAVNEPWRMVSSSGSRWLKTVEGQSAGRFGDIGPIRVGIKTTADRVFIRPRWDDLPEDERPESTLIHPLLTHRVARQWRASNHADGARSVLYPHEIHDGRRAAIDLTRFPRAAAYLERYRKRLESREYVRKAGRAWYEIWVPQKPDGWAGQKLVWPDISDRPKVFLDDSGAIVNGDCYWLACDGRSDEEIALTLAVANSSFALRYYDLCCGNRLYAGRRRFTTQYVETLPVPEVSGADMQAIKGMVDELREGDTASDGDRLGAVELQLDEAVSGLFGLVEVPG